MNSTFINYEDKVALNERPEVAEINKVTAGNMNEIKEVVNNNADVTNKIKDEITIKILTGEEVQLNKTVDGKQVYFQKIDCGKLGTGIIDINLSDLGIDASKINEFNSYGITDANLMYTLNPAWVAMNGDVQVRAMPFIDKGVSKLRFNMGTNVNLSDVHAWANIEYFKD